MRRYKKKRGLIFEREVSEIYVRKIWSRSVIKIISWNCTDITGSFNFSHLGIFYIAGIVLLVYTYYRMFSKNISKMYAQNQKYLNAKYRAVVKKDAWKKQWQQRKIYRFYRCPGCKQKVRVPKGKGKICITCPKCRMEFIKKS